jgi:group I intron endonuclease
MKKYSVYLLTCATNGKLYVGYTSETVDKRWRRHVYASRNPRNPINYAIAAHGEGSFLRATLATFDNVEEALAAEREMIVFHKSLCGQNGYNVSRGGESASGVKRSDAFKAALGERMKLLWKNSEWRTSLKNSMSNAQKQRYKDIELRKEHARKQKEWVDETFKTKMRAIGTLQASDPVWLSKVSDGVKRSWEKRRASVD